jgi:hypothetical protein
MAIKEKVADKVEKTARKARNTASDGIQESGTLASEVLDSLSSRVHGKERRGGLFGYLGRHPMQLLLMLGLMTGVVALIAVPMLRGRLQAEDEIDPITGRNLSATD